MRLKRTISPVLLTSPAGAVSRRSWKSLARSLLPAGASALLIGALAWPLLFTRSAIVGDWSYHLWLLWHQSLAIRSNHFPSLFLNSSYSVFYPEYAFYGGTVYVLGGTLSLVLGGNPVQAYILTYLMGFAAAYGGWYWMGRMAGLGRWSAQAPGLAFITSAYYLTLIYGRGDWPEFLGVSMIPLLVASGLNVLRADQLHTLPATALAGSGIVFFGSHNLTLLWGSTMIALTGLAIIVCVPDARRQITRRGVTRVAALLVPAALVSAWYLLPTLAYESRTVIGSSYESQHRLLEAFMGLVSSSNLFTISRASAPEGAFDFPLSLPIVVIGWVMVSVLILPWSSRSWTWIRLLLIFSCMAVLITIVMTHVGIILSLPLLYTYVQFSYRLESYILLSISAAVLAVLVLIRGSSNRMRLWTWTVIPVLIVSLVGAIQEVDAYPNPDTDRNAVVRTFGENMSTGDYADATIAPLSYSNLPEVDFSPTSIHGDHVSRTVHLAPGQLAATNIGGGPYLVHVTGARVVGRIGQENRLVIAIGAGASPKQTAQRGAHTHTETISVSTADSLPVILGRLLTLSGAIILALQFLALPIRRVRARRA
jgi:hypothetical protein